MRDLRLLPLALLLTSCDQDSAAPATAPPVDTAPLLAKVAAIVDGFPAADTLQPKPCVGVPDRLPSIAYGSLLHRLGRELPPEEQALSGPINGVDSSAIAYLPFPSIGGGQPERAVKEAATETHVGVLRVVTGKLAEVLETGVFQPGVLRGWLVVFDLATHAAVCQWPVEATNSDNVSYRSGGGDQYDLTSQRQYLSDDLRDQIKKATDLAEARMLPAEAPR